MASTDHRALGEVFQEIKGVLVVRKKLEDKDQRHVIFAPNGWTIFYTQPYEH